MGKKGLYPFGAVAACGVARREQTQDTEGRGTFNPFTYVNTRVSVEAFICYVEVTDLLNTRH